MNPVPARGFAASAWPITEASSSCPPVISPMMLKRRIIALLKNFFLFTRPGKTASNRSPSDLNELAPQKRSTTMKTSVFKVVCFSLIVFGLSFGGSLAFAEDSNTNPAGWSQGEKKGWDGATPPGLSQKEADKAAKKAKKEVEKAEKKAKKEAAKAEKKAKKEAEKAAKKAKKDAAKKAEEKAKKAKEDAIKKKEKAAQKAEAAKKKAQEVAQQRKLAAEKKAEEAKKLKVEQEKVKEAAEKAKAEASAQVPEEKKSLGM